MLYSVVPVDRSNGAPLRHGSTPKKHSNRTTFLIIQQNQSSAALLSRWETVLRTQEKENQQQRQG